MIILIIDSMTVSGPLKSGAVLVALSYYLLKHQTMLKELFDLVRGQATETVINNPDVPNEHNNEVVAEATNTVASGLRNLVAGGGLQSVLALFGGGTNKKSLLSNPIISMMMGHFASKLMNKFNMKTHQANNLSGQLRPNGMSEVINKSNDPNDSAFSLEKLLASITVGKSETVTQGGGIGGLLRQFSGSDVHHNGGGGLLDIVKTLAGGAQEQQQRNGGGLLDLIKGFGR